MKEKITLTFLLLLIGIFSVIINVNANTDEAPPHDESRTEDDGWVEGDYEGSLEEQEEQAQEDWEDAGRPGEKDDDNKSDKEELYECPDGSLVPFDTARCPNLSAQELRELEEAILNDPTAPYWLPACDGSYQDCVTEKGDVCLARQCELPNPGDEVVAQGQPIPFIVATEGPDGDCLFDTTLPKCAEPPGGCPVGFFTNEDNRCFPDHRDEGCPEGFHTTEDDETGECNPNAECTGEDYVLVNNGENCREKRTWCLERPNVDECKDEKSNNEFLQSILNSSPSPKTDSVTDTNEWNMSCYDTGYGHKQLESFNKLASDYCGERTNGAKSYYLGYINGCNTLKDKTIEMCESVDNL